MRFPSVAAVSAVALGLVLAADPVLEEVDLAAAVDREGECAADDAECALRLVQLRGARSAPALVQADSRRFERGLALEGGGFHSVMCFSGLTAGLLKVHGRKHSVDKPTLEGSRLFEGFDAVSSVSGGSWFFALMTYASSFKNTVSAMAATDANATNVFAKGYVEPLMSTGVENNRFERFVQIAAEIEGPAIDRIRLFDMAKETGYFWNEGNTWVEFIGTLLNTSAGIGTDVQLGTKKVEPWAKGKTWLVDHSVVMASKADEAEVWSVDESKVTYSVDSKADDLPVYLPAIFSVKLGAGADHSAPLPYFSAGADKALQNVKYAESGPKAENLTRTDSVKKFPKHVRDMGELPVHAVVAASSAAGGGICLSSFEGLIEDIVGADFTPWMASVGGGRDFQAAQDLVQGQKSVTEIARHEVRAVIDGGYTDNTAIAHLAAAGATNIVSFLDVGDKERSWSFTDLFQGPEVQGNTMGIPWIHFQIFAENSADVAEQLLALPRITYPDAKFLNFISIGTINATTVDNEWFGTKAGNKVSIRVVSVSSHLWVDNLAGFAGYSDLVNDIVEAISHPDNEEVVHAQLIDPLLLMQEK